VVDAEDDELDDNAAEITRSVERPASCAPPADPECNPDKNDFIEDLYIE